MLPFGIIICVRRNVDRNALLVERGARERHVALPADEAPDFAPGRVHHGEEILLRIAPDEPLGAGWFQLAVIERLAFGGNKHIGIVKRCGVFFALGVAEAEINAEPLRAVDQLPHFLAVCENGIVVIDLPILAPGLLAAADSVAECHAVGVAREKELGEDDELCAVFRRFFDEAERLLQARIFIEHHGCGLHNGEAAVGFQVFHPQAIRRRSRWGCSSASSKSRGTCRQLYALRASRAPARPLWGQRKPSRGRPRGARR